MISFVGSDSMKVVRIIRTSLLSPDIDRAPFRIPLQLRLSAIYTTAIASLRTNVYALQLFNLNSANNTRE